MTLLMLKSACSYFTDSLQRFGSRLGTGGVIRKQRHNTQLWTTFFRVFKISGFNASSVFVFIILLFFRYFESADFFPFQNILELF